MTQRADVVVVGGGVMGSATAWWLARRGRDVVVLEQFDQGHARGSSHGATRIFRLAYPDPHFVAMAQEALPLWRELEAEAGSALLDSTGAVDFGTVREVELIARALRARGVEHDVLSPDAAAECWPGRRFAGRVLYHPEGGRCRADAAVRAFQDRAAAAGADLRFGTGPAALELWGEGVAVRAGDDEWRVPVVVVTAGPWLPKVLAGMSIAARRLPPLRVTRERIQHFAGADETWPSFIHHRYPWVYGLFSPGEGMKVAAHMVGAEVDPDSPDGSEAPPDDAVVRYVEEWFPGLDPTPVHPATCLYTTTPDERFVLERVGPVVIGSPCSGHGFKFAPLVGRMLADLVDEAVTRRR